MPNRNNGQGWYEMVRWGKKKKRKRTNEKQITEKFIVVFRCFGSCLCVCVSFHWNIIIYDFMTCQAKSRRLRLKVEITLCFCFKCKKRKQQTNRKPTEKEIDEKYLFFFGSSFECFNCLSTNNFGEWMNFWIAFIFLLFYSHTLKRRVQFFMQQFLRNMKQ